MCRIVLLYINIISKLVNRIEAPISNDIILDSGVVFALH